MGINYDDVMVKLNTSDKITGVETEGDKVSNPHTKKLYYSKAVRMSSGKNKLTSTHLPH